MGSYEVGLQTLSLSFGFRNQSWVMPEKLGRPTFSLNQFIARHLFGQPTLVPSPDRSQGD
jgi:hypothetical protein